MSPDAPPYSHLPRNKQFAMYLSIRIIFLLAFCSSEVTLITFWKIKSFFPHLFTFCDWCKVLSVSMIGQQLPQILIADFIQMKSIYSCSMSKCHRFFRRFLMYFINIYLYILMFAFVWMNYGILYDTAKSYQSTKIICIKW